MAISLSSQAIAAGLFSPGNFTQGLVQNSVGPVFWPGVFLLNAAGSAVVDPSLFMQSTGGTVGLVAGSAQIGSVLGRSSNPQQTPVVTSNGVYAAGLEVGGKMTFAVGGAGTGGELKHVTVVSKTPGLLGTMIMAIFTTNPTNSTWTDHAALNINALDLPFLLAIIPMSVPNSGLGNVTIWEAANLGYQFSCPAPNLYAVMWTVPGITLNSASTSDMVATLGLRLD